MTRQLTSLLIVAVLLGATGAAAWGVPSESALNESREEARRLDREVAEAEAELEQVQAELAVLEEELEDAERRLAVADEEHVAADREATAAADRARAAEAELEEAVRELELNTERLGSIARDTYKHGAPAGSPAMAALEALGSSGDREGLADRLHYLQRSVGARSVVLERSESLRTTVEALTERAREEELEAQRLLVEAEAKRDEAARLHAEVAELTSQTSDRLDRSAQLLRTLEERRQDVGSRIEQLEARVAREREEAARRERERRERERRARERAARSGGGSSVSVGSGPSGGLRTVGGITVAASIADQVAALLNHARRDGIVLGGHGYRSPQVTARLRRTNGCPDVYSSPASACRVPTARPGTSQHEKGLAIDFTYQGRTICYPRPGSRCSGNPAFDWLRRHAGSYGLRNLSTEAWHWSTTSR